MDNPQIPHGKTGATHTVCVAPAELAKKYRLLAAIALTASMGVLFAEVFPDDDTDSDADGWTDSVELAEGTNPLDPADPWDSDGDGFPDHWEFENAYDPLDPLDPPAGTVLPQNMSATHNLSAVGESSILRINYYVEYLSKLSYSGKLSIHNPNANGGSAVDYNFLAGENGWSAVNGNKIEFWSTGEVDLEANGGNSGIQCALKNLTPGNYALVWLHCGRWNSVANNSPAGNEYQVKILSGGSEVKREAYTPIVGERTTNVLYFSLTDAQIKRGVKIVFDPNSNNTRGALIGTNIRLLKEPTIRSEAEEHSADAFILYRNAPDPESKEEVLKAIEPLLATRTKFGVKEVLNVAFDGINGWDIEFDVGDPEIVEIGEGVGIVDSASGLTCGRQYRLTCKEKKEVRSLFLVNSLFVAFRLPLNRLKKNLQLLNRKENAMKRHRLTI